MLVSTIEHDSKYNFERFEGTGRVY